MRRATGQAKDSASPWWLQPLIIMGHQYPVDVPRDFSPRALEKVIRWKRSLGFDAEHLLTNYSMVEGAEGGEDSRAYLFKNRHGYVADMLGAYLPLAARHGLRVIVYFNCHWFRGTAFSDDFFMRDADGKAPPLYGSGPGVCPRGPFRDWSVRMAEDLGCYPIAGVFLDGPLQQRCFCAACRDEFRKRHGVAMPATADACPPELAEAYAGFPQDGAIGYVRAFAGGLHRRNPDALVYINDIGPGADGATMAATRDCTRLVGAEGGFVGYNPLNDKFGFAAGVTAKILEARAAGRGRVVFCDCGYKCFDYYVHPKGEIARMYAGTIANGANPWFLVLRSGAKTAGLRAATRFNELIADNAGALANGHSLAEAAILHSALNYRLGKAAARVGDDVGNREGAAGKLAVSRHGSELEGVYAALARSGYPFDVVEEANLLAGGLSPRIRLLILPAVGAMSDAVAEKIRRFVAAGGRLLATFDSSLFDEQGRRRPDYALADVFGASVDGGLLGPSKLDYLAFAGRGKLSAGIEQPILPCPEYWWHVKAARSATALLYCREKMPRRYAQLPPVSDRPAAILHRFGKGQALLIPSAVGDHYRHWAFPDQRQLLANAAGMLAASPVTVDGGNGFVEASLRRGANGAIVLHLVNWAGGTRPAQSAAPVGPLSVRIRLPRGVNVRRARTCMEPRPLKLKPAGGAVRFALPRLAEYEMVVIE